jgi:hypothetical protein
MRPPLQPPQGSGFEKEGFMHLSKQIRLVVLFRAIVALGLNIHAVNAQSQSTIATPEKTDTPEPADQGLHVDVAPYLWFPGINGTVGVLDHESSVHVTAKDVLSNFNFGLMGAVEIRYNRIIIPVDFMWVRLKDEKGIPITDDVESVKVQLTELIFTPKVGYRLVDKPRFKTDTLFGLRYWHLGTTLTLEPQISNGFYGAANWVDAVAGARFQTLLTRKLILTVAGDAGGGWSGTRLDYQVVGLLGYKVKRVTLQGGWRYLVIHRRHTGESFVDLAMTGVALGVVIPVK